MKYTFLQGLYVLTDSRVHPHQQWPGIVESAILGGANIIQLREKSLGDSELLPVALEIKQICSDYAVRYIVNDRLELAKKINADGVHIGQHDTSICAAREYLGGNFFIGVSCYRNLYSAFNAQKSGADYVAFGSVFPSKTKIHAPLCPLSVISRAHALLRIPVCAIGGITSNNSRHVLRAGANLIAVTDSVFNAKNPEIAAYKLNHQVIMRS